MRNGVRLSAGLLIITATLMAGFSLQMPESRSGTEHDDRAASDEFSHKLQQRKALRDRRDAWWQWIHNTAPGDNWQAIERENRHQHQLNRNAMRKQAGQSGLKALISSEDTFPQLGLSGRWSEVGSTTQAGRILATEYNRESGDILAIADGGQLWRRDGSAGEWSSLNDTLKMERGIGVHSTEIDGATRIALINRFAPMIFLYSDDDGQTWTESAVPPLANFEDTFLTDSWQLNDSGEIITCGRKSFAGQNQFPCFHSTDGGGSFREFASYTGTAFTTMDHWVDTDSGRIYGLTVRDGIPRLVEYRTSGTVSDTEMSGVVLGSSDSGFQLTGSGNTLYAAMPYEG